MMGNDDQQNQSDNTHPLLRSAKPHPWQTGAFILQQK
jgi:hypothetical protein